jgi:hypothetical protein
MDVNGRQNVDDLLARMETVRGRIDQDAQAAKQSVEQMTDWRYLVRKNPLVAVALAATAGFLLVPKKKPEPKFTDEDLKKLSKEHTVIVTKEASASPGVIGAVAATAGAALTRAATSYLTAKVSEFSGFSQREDH